MNYANLYEITGSLICFQYPVLLVILCHKTKQKYTKYMHLDCPKSGKKCFSTFFFQLMPDVSARSCLMYHSCFKFCCMMYHITKQSVRKSHPKSCFFSVFSFYFLTYLLNNISTRDINNFNSSYIYSFMPVLDWSIIPYRKISFIFTNQLLAPKQLFS